MATLFEPTNPIFMVAVFIGLALVPFLALALTSFIKLSVVFGILRNALGAQQIPSGAVVSLLSLVLTLHIMAPLGEEIAGLLGESALFAEEKLEISDLGSAVSTAAIPLEGFLRKHSNSRERLFFAGLRTETPQEELNCDDEQCIPPGESFFTLVPSFVLSELSEAFAIGFTLFLPFLIVDLVIANLLVGLGMMMVSPVTISLPFKIILFVLCDGWFLLARGLVLGYQ